jgi:pimeloyl-ACP methyl ester carboxylesterase
MTEQLRTAAPFMCKVDLSTADFRQNRPEDVSRTLAFVAVTHSDERLASVFVTAPDGLTLHVRKYRSRVASALPVVCLPGLARTAADFHLLAAALAADPAKPRLVLAIDYRGHGQSEHDLSVTGELMFSQ